MLQVYAMLRESCSNGSNILAFLNISKHPWQKTGSKPWFLLCARICPTSGQTFSKTERLNGSLNLQQQKIFQHPSNKFSTLFNCFNSPSSLQFKNCWMLKQCWNRHAGLKNVIKWLKEKRLDTEDGSWTIRIMPSLFSATFFTFNVFCCLFGISSRLRMMPLILFTHDVPQLRSLTFLGVGHMMLSPPRQYAGT